jgi:hypothetical protein
MKHIAIQLTEEQVRALLDALKWYQSALGDSWSFYQTADPKVLRRQLRAARTLFELRK